MKIKQGYILRSVADAHVVVAVGEQARSFHGLIRLNDCGAFLFERLQAGATREELLAAMLEAYQVEETRAAADLDAFLSNAAKAALLDA